MTSSKTVGSATLQGALWGASPEDWAELEEPRTAQLVHDVVDALAVRAGTRLLDAGCGAGGPARVAAERGAAVSGLDASAGMIDVARRRLSAARWQVGDLEQLPYGDGEFDAVMAINSVFYCADVAHGMAELARVTRSGGRVAITAWGKPEDCQMAAVFKALLATLPQKPAGGGPFALSAPGALDALLAAAGLRPVSGGASRCELVSPSWDAYWRGVSSAGPLQGAMRAAGADVVKSAVREAVAPFTRADGAIELANTFVWAVGEKT